MKRFFVLLSTCLFCFADTPGLISVGGGIYEVVRKNQYRSGLFRLEYLFPQTFYTVRPLAGFMANLKGSTYLYTGISFDWVLKKSLIFAPNFAVGWYRKGHGKKLGFPLEFRSGLEMGWQLPSKMRVGAHFYHISNASLAHTIGNRNPGEESLVFFISVPIL